MSTIQDIQVHNHDIDSYPGKIECLFMKVYNPGYSGL
jgi:hypothetical protein